MAEILNGGILEQYGITPDMLSFNEFDPQALGGLNERDFSKRGIFQSDGKVIKNAKITLTLKNNTSSRVLTEMFNPLRSITKYPNDAMYSDASRTDYYATPFKPFSNETALGALKLMSDSVKTGNAIADLSTILNYKAVISDATGNLIYSAQGNPPATTGAIYPRTLNQATDHDVLPYLTMGSQDNSAVATVSCGQMPYSSLLSQLEGLVLLVKKWNFNLTSEAQVKNDLFYKYYTVSGADTNNSDNIVISPMQYQSKIFDVNQLMAIDKRTAMFWTLEANEQVTITMYVDAYRDNSVIAQGLKG